MTLNPILDFSSIITQQAQSGRGPQKPDKTPRRERQRLRQIDTNRQPPLPISPFPSPPKKTADLILTILQEVNEYPLQTLLSFFSSNCNRLLQYFFAPRHSRCNCDSARYSPLIKINSISSAPLCRRRLSIQLLYCVRIKKRPNQRIP